MKSKMYKKIVSLVSAFSLAVTGLTGLNFTASAADGEDVFDPKMPASKKCLEITRSAGDTDEIDIRIGTDKKHLFIDGNELNFLDDNEDGNYPGFSENPDSLMWVIETTTPGVGSAAAGFKNHAAKGANKYTITKKLTYNDTQGKNKKLASLLPTSDGVLTIGNFKANGLYNNTLIVKLVSKEYKVKYEVPEGDTVKRYMHKGNDSKEYAAFRVFISPAEVTGVACTASKPTEKAGIKFTLPTYNNGVQTQPGYLELEEGKSFKLPYNVVKGLAADTSLIWEIADSKVATVINGTVKAISSSGNDTTTITVRSATNSSKSAAINLKVTPAEVKALRANTTSINLVTKVNQQSDIAYVTVSPKTPIKSNQTFTYDVKFEKNTKKTLSIVDKKTGANGVYHFGVQANKNFNGFEKGEKLTVTLKKIGSKEVNVKPITISLKTTTYPDYVKSFKETVKLNKASGYRELNLVNGTCYNLGVSVNPVTANNNFGFAAYDKDPREDSANRVGTDKVDFVDDVVYAKECGTYYLQASGGLMEDGNYAKTSVYKLNVYEPAKSTFKMNDSTYTIKGGYLMTKANADTFCDKTIEGGKEISFIAPSCSGIDEPVNWTINKQGSVNFDVDGSNIKLKVLVAGTYTITGVSAYTGMKYSFKVMANATEDSYNLEDFNESSIISLTIGETKQIQSPVKNYCGKKIVFSVDDNAKKLVSVNGNGLVTAKKVSESGTGNVTAKIYSATKVNDDNLVDTYTLTVTVDPASTALGKVTVDKVYVNGNADSAISFKADNSKGYKWYAACADFPTFTYTAAVDENTPASIDATPPAFRCEEITRTKKIPKYINLTAKNELETLETYLANEAESDRNDYSSLVWTVFALPDGADKPTSMTEVDAVDLDHKVTVTALRKYITKTVKIADSDMDLKSLAKDNVIVVDKNTKVSSIKVPNGINPGADKTFILRVAVDSKEKDAEIKDIDWKVSNAFLINPTVEEVDDENLITEKDEETGVTSNKYYKEYIFTVNNLGYTGKVTLTGVTKNGNKTIKQVVWVTKPTV